LPPKKKTRHDDEQTRNSNTWKLFSFQKKDQIL
jgi:hypothetical protein